MMNKRNKNIGNPHCICPVAGYCHRHKMIKSDKSFQICKGLVTGLEDCGFKFWQAWENGRLRATAPEEPILTQDWECVPDASTTRTSRTSSNRPKSRNQLSIRESLLTSIERSNKCLVGSRIKYLLLAKYNISTNPGCKCNKRAAQLDQMGCDGCEESFSEIVDWLLEGAAERKWLAPFLKILEGPAKARAGKLLQEAIDLEKIKVTNFKEPVMKHKVVPWAYGLTTVHTRLDTTLPITLKSLANAGFTDPWIFIDGLGDESILKEIAIGEKRLSSYNYVVRKPLIKTFGNWILGLWELYIRFPLAERYAMFQDDFIMSSHLKSYLSSCKFPRDGEDRGYWNLYSFPRNEKLSNGTMGWYPSNQKGLGAVALVFTRDCVMDLLSSKENIVERPTVANRRSYSNIDGGIVDALRKKGWKEYVHNPSLIQHIGDVSSMGSTTHPKSTTFKGEEFDARQFLS